MSRKKFTIDEIRTAFYNAFHKQGEVFFKYFEEEYECENSTQDKWLWFLDHLDSILSKVEREFSKH